MAKYFGSGDLPLKCLKCGHKFSEKVAVVETDPDIACPSCGVVTHYDAKDVRRAMRDVAKAIDGLKDTISKFGKS